LRFNQAEQFTGVRPQVRLALSMQSTSNQVDALGWKVVIIQTMSVLRNLFLLGRAQIDEVILESLLGYNPDANPGHSKSENNLPANDFDHGVWQTPDGPLVAFLQKPAFR
jgi:hypothetical protein